ncbi:type VI secretion system lipoprotein TssJ [Noviherbaspirillum saxi]|uniref:Type VI secretion system lipoprotein TssJ n=1 Tax=Noviherbaspirillum saxi TaxID=2320863 RepID=A0A3A3FKK8_9BURK|nr:type VI secretion system lipoprotein TssJ [Noviherbaspirillum saxi]RJF95837.1 type VI secretion system lipoprotein TssJ [Noviherbaspirillum saxi]
MWWIERQQPQQQEKLFNLCPRAKFIKRCLPWTSCLLLLACGTTQQSAGSATDNVLSIIGLKRFGTDAPPSSRKVRLRIEGAHGMNSGGAGQGVPTVLRLYKLRTQTSFLSAPQQTFGHPEKERIALGPDLAEVREFILIPGQSLHVNEALPDDAHHVGVVALFRRPSGQRWRMAFTARDIEESGLILGVHACALTSTGAIPIGMVRGDALLLSAAPCIQ